MLTVQCEWFPAEPTEVRPDPWRKGEEGWLETEARLFGAAVRTAFNRLAEGLTRAARGKATTPPAGGDAAPERGAEAVETLADKAAALRAGLKQRLQTDFGLNSRYADDAILKANEVIGSQRALIPVEIEETEAKRVRTERKRKANARKAERLEAAGRGQEATAVAHAVRGQELRLAKLDAKLAEYRRYRADGTIPRMVFGGRRLWRRLCRSVGPEHARLRAKWRVARRGRLYSRGDASKGGNPNLRITLGKDGDLTLAAAISHLSEKTGHSTYIRQGKLQERDTHAHAPWVTGRLWVPRKHEALLWDLLLSGRPYTVEALRAADGRWRVHVGFTPQAPGSVVSTDRGVVGLDLNPHGVAVAHVGQDGNPLPWPEGIADHLCVEAKASLHKYVGELQVGVAPGRMWLHAPEMWQADEDRRTYLVGVVAKLGVDVAVAVGRPLVHEDLGFAKEHDTNRAFNRYSSNFPYAELIEAIDRRGRRCGVPVTQVDPAYTSAEGRWRFAGDRGWSVHEAAALCIGRKALGQAHRFPRQARKHIERVCQALGVLTLSGPGGNPSVRGSCRVAQVRLLPTAPQGANLRPKGAKTWSGGRCGRPRDRFVHIFLTRESPCPRSPQRRRPCRRASTPTSTGLRTTASACSSTGASTPCPRATSGSATASASRRSGTSAISLASTPTSSSRAHGRRWPGRPGCATWW